MATVISSKKADPHNNWRHDSPNIGRNVEGISAEWLEMWHEIECWYGDPRCTESPEKILLRLQKHYNLSSRWGKKGVIGELGRAWVRLWHDIAKWYHDPDKAETGREFILRMQMKYTLWERLLDLKDGKHHQGYGYSTYILGKNYIC